MGKLFVDQHPLYNYATPTGKMIADKIWQKKTLNEILYNESTRKKFLWALGVRFTATQKGYECVISAKNKRKLSYRTNMHREAVEQWHILKDFQHIIGLKNVHIRNIFLIDLVRTQFIDFLRREFIFYRSVGPEQGYVSNRLILISKFVTEYKKLIARHNRETGKYRRKNKF